jgi:hypothetical protein
MTLRWFGSWEVVLALGAISVMSAISCSDDGDMGPADMASAGGSMANAPGAAGAATTGNAGSTAGNAGAAGTAGAAAAGAGGAAGSLGTAGSMGMAVNGPVSFASDVWPILRANCSSVACHGEGSFLPKHAQADVDLAYAEAKPVADRIAGRVSGELTPIMPQFCGPAPGLGTCLSLEEVAIIQAWNDQGAPP